MLVSSYACSPDTADMEFGFTLSHCMEKGNNLAFHLIQSFKPGETNQETAHKIGTDLAQEVLKGKYEYVLSTHIDNGHIHNHQIFCAANFVDYRKFVSNKKSYYQIRKASDRCCEQYGLSIVIPSEEKGKCYIEYLAQESGISWKDHLKKAVNQSIKYSSFEEFILRMSLSGYEVRPGSKLAFHATDQKRFILSKTLGAGFSEDRIYQKISQRLSGKALQKLDLLTNLQSSIKPMHSPGYTRVVKLQNLKIAARTLEYLTKEGISSYFELKSKQEQITNLFTETSTKIKILEMRINEFTVIIKKFEIIQGSSSITGFTSQNKNGLQDAAIKYLITKGVQPPYPKASDFSKQLVGLNAEKKSLNSLFDSVKKDWKLVLTIVKDIASVLQPNRKSGLQKE